MKLPAPFLSLVLTALPLLAIAQEVPAQPAEVPAPVAAAPAEKPAAKPNPVLIPGLPTYNPPPAETKALDQPADPDVLELPKMTVKQKPRPRLTPDVVFTKNAFGEDLAKKKFSSLDQTLNKFTLPLFGASLAQRALEEYEREKNEKMVSDVGTIATALEQTDPAEAKALREAVSKR